MTRGEENVPAWILFVGAGRLKVRARRLVIPLKKITRPACIRRTRYLFCCSYSYAVTGTAVAYTFEARDARTASR